MKRGDYLSQLVYIDQQPTADQLEKVIDNFLLKPLPASYKQFGVHQAYMIRLPDATYVQADVVDQLRVRYQKADWADLEVIYGHEHEYSTHLKLVHHQPKTTP